jgi:DNA-binding NtrC family response regulator
MERPIIVVDADKGESEELCAALEQDNYRTVALDSLLHIGKKIQETACRVLILDLDNLPVDNRLITNLRRENPGLPIIGLSSSPFHPDLEEAMSSHICACLSRPPDFGELIYCIRSFCNNGLSGDEEPQKKERTQDVEP